MDEIAFKILKKIYTNENEQFDSNKFVYTYTIPKMISDQDRAYLYDQHLEVNSFENFSHDDVVDRLIDIFHHVNLKPERIAKSFIAGVGGSYRRGLQPFISYYYTKHLTKHEFEGDGDHCSFCGIEKNKWANISYEIFYNYWGYAWNEMPLKYLIDLEQFVKQPEINPTDKDIDIFNQLLDTIRYAPIHETPSLLEKRIKKEKIIPNVDKYRRYGILEALSEVGVIPNTVQTPSYDTFISTKEKWVNAQNLKGNTRSDIGLPFGVWNGSLGIDIHRAKEIFGDYIRI